MQTITPDYSILPDAQKALLPELKAVTDLGFVLYGGTAIALQLGHRESIDFDFFTDQTFDSESLFKKLTFLKEATTLQESPNTLTVIVNGVKVSFFGGLTFGRVQAPSVTKDEILILANLHDLLGLKLAVLLKRVEVKDYKDITALLRHGLSLEEGLAYAKAFYPNLQPNECLKALVYFKEGDVHQLSREDKALLVNHVQQVGQLPQVTISSFSLASQDD